jgi:hypothetical protein
MCLYLTCAWCVLLVSAYMCKSAGFLPCHTLTDMRLCCVSVFSRRRSMSVPISLDRFQMKRFVSGDGSLPCSRSLRCKYTPWDELACLIPHAHTHTHTHIHTHTLSLSLFFFPSLSLSLLTSEAFALILFLHWCASALLCLSRCPLLNSRNTFQRANFERALRVLKKSRQDQGSLQLEQLLGRFVRRACDGDSLPFLSCTYRRPSPCSAVYMYTCAIGCWMRKTGYRCEIADGVCVPSAPVLQALKYWSGCKCMAS